MHLTNYKLFNPKNHFYTNPINGLRGYGLSYRFAFNGQEKDDEVSSAGNTMTATFWEYDARLARRWNLDPIYYRWQSRYVVFNNCPLSFADPDGLFAKRKDARKYKKGHDIDGIVKKNKDGTFSVLTKNKVYTAGNDEGLNLEKYKNDGVTEDIYIRGEKEIKGGKVNSFGAGFAFGGGYQFEIGTVTDSEGNEKLFFSHGPVLGFTLSVGFSEKAIKTANSKDFKVSDFEGPGAGYSLGILIGGVDYSGNKRNKSFKNSDFDGKGDDYQQLGFGFFQGLDFGLSWSKTNTVFINK
jgi:hypothetical protein